MHNRVFVGYFESNDEATKNRLYEQLDAIENSFNGKIFECASNNEFNYKELDEMIVEAIKNKCDTFIVLVEKSIDSKKLKECINTEWKKAFENVYVTEENFKRFKEATPAGTQQGVTQQQAQSQQAQQQNTQQQNQSQQQGLCTILFNDCQWPDRSSVIQQFAASVNSVRAGSKSNLLLAYTPIQGKLYVAPYQKLVSSCKYNNSLTPLFVGQDSIYIINKQDVESKIIPRANMIDKIIIAQDNPAYNILASYPILKSKITTISYGSAKLHSNTVSLEKIMDSFEAFKEKFDNKALKKQVEEKNVLKGIVINDAIRMALNFLEIFYGFYILAKINNGIATPDAEEKNSNKIKQKKEVSSFKDYLYALGVNYDNLRSNGLDGLIKNMADQAEKMKKNKDDKAMDGNGKKEKNESEKFLSADSKITDLQKLFLLWDEKDKAIKFVTENFLK